MNIFCTIRFPIWIDIVIKIIIVLNRTLLSILGERVQFYYLLC